MTAGVTVGVMVLAGGFFQSLPQAQAADFTCVATTEDELGNCITSGDPANSVDMLTRPGDSITITLGNDFPINHPEIIAAGLNVTITSDNAAGGGQRVLTRGNSDWEAWNMFVVQSNAIFSVDHVIFDGANLDLGPADSRPMIEIFGEMTMGAGAVVRNGINSYPAYKQGVIDVSSGGSLIVENDAQIINNRAMYGAVTCYDAGSSLEVTGDVVVSGNETTYGAGGAFYIANGCQATFGGHAHITGNSGPYNGGAVACYDAGTLLTVGGDVVVSGNEADYYGGAFYIGSGCQATFGGSAEISGNSASYGGAVYCQDAGSSLTVTDGAKVPDNEATYGGAFYIYNGCQATFGGSAQIADNDADFGGAVMCYGAGTSLAVTGSVGVSGNEAGQGGAFNITDGCQATFGGSAQIADNDADYGGAVICGAGALFEMTDSVEVSGNEAYMGGAFYIYDGCQASFNEKAKITGNTATATGGGIQLADPNTTLSLAGTVDISGNTAGGDGGGIYLDPTVTSGLAIPAGVRVTGNTAGGDGGGIYLAYAQLPQLTVEAGATFTDNKAATVTPDRSPLDDDLYAQKIAGTDWTSPLTQGYNNYDIAYHAAQIGLSITGALADEDKYFEGDLILWTYVITNNDDIDMTGVTLTDLNDPALWDLTALTCLDEDDNPFALGTDSTDVLASGASVTCTATSKIRQADIDNTEAYNYGSVAGTAQVDPSAVTTSPGPATSGQVRGVALIPQHPQLTVEKTSSVAVGSKAKVGDQITFTITVTNTGNVALSGIEVGDGMDGLAVTCDGQDNGAIALALGASITCKTDPYTVTQADAAKGQIVNVATATGDDVTGDGDVTIEVEPLAPGIHLTKRGTAVNPEHPHVGDVVTWTFEIANTGDADLSQVTIDDQLDGLSEISCTLDGAPFTLGSADMLPVGKTANCTATSKVSQADIDNTGAVNTASVSGADLAGKKAVFGPVTAVAPLAQNPAYNFEKTAAYVDTNNNGQADAGETIVFTITLENQGNVTLNQVKINDDTMAGLALTCVNKTTGQTVENDGNISLPPGQTVECVSNAYTITADDATNGSVVNLATFAAEVGNPAPPVLRQPGDNSGQGSIDSGSRVVVPIAPQQQAPTGGWVAPALSWLWLGGFAPLLAGVGWLLRRRRQAGDAS